MPVRCLVHFAQAHPEFRLPELQSIAELNDFTFSKPENLLNGLIEAWDPQHPFWIIDLEEEWHASALAERCILVRSVYEFYARGASYKEVHDQARMCRHLWERYIERTSFRFTVSAYKHTIPLRRQREVVETFAFMGLLGPIELKTPELVLAVFEEYDYQSSDALRSRNENDGKFSQVYFGRLISEGKARPLMQKFDVKKRAYFGNTSMEAEISLLMANQSLASPGKFIYDPFVGTGSMAYTAAQFGAFVFGSDIDGRQMRGKDNETGIIRAATQYGVAARIIDLCTFDVTQNPLRCGDLFDAILTDPPYGVRAGAKRLGRKANDNRTQKRDPELQKALSIALSQYVPPTQPYELSELVADLVRLARHLLRPGGRLVFFLPTVTEDYADVDVAALLCPGMEIIANSVQDFGSWGRRLITIKKITKESYPSPFIESTKEINKGVEGHIPAHKDFREKYFKGFRRDENAPQ